MKKSRKLGSARGWLACSLCLLLVISSLVQPLISSASERRLTPGFSSTQHPNAEGKKVTPLAPERGTPTGLNLPNLDAVRYRQRQELKAPAPIESTMRSRRKAQKPQQKQKSHHAISRRQFSANLSSPTQPLAPQSNPPSFTDDPLKDPNNPDSFKIKALHLTELRYWINLLRNRRGLGDYSWVKPAASGGALNSSVLIGWEPIDEMRTALNQAIGPPANGYAQGLGLSQLILAAHVQELRDRVKSEWGSSLADQLVPARIDLFNQSGNQIEARDCEWGIPLVSLPGRAGLDLGISLSYSSLVWSTAGSAISFDDDRGDPSPGFKLGFPTIQGRYIDNQVGTNVYLLITSAGRRVELRRVGSSNIYEAGDSSYLQLIEDGNSLLLHTTDGTRMSYAKTGSDWHCTAIEDRNGNLISATYNGDDLATVTDTLSRVFYFNYDANGNLTSIRQNWSGGWRDLATFGWGTQTLHPAFSGYTAVGAYDGEVIPVLTQVGLMDGSHYNFEYTDRGQVNMIRHYVADGATGPAGDLQLSYLAYNYESPAGDCPRISAARLWATNWNIVNGVPAEVPTYFADNHDGTHQMTTPDSTVYKELYGSDWKHGLVTSSQVITGSTVQKTTTTSWTQDNEGAGYQTNPRVYQTLVSDGTHNRKTTIDYQTFTLPVSNVSCSLPNEVNEYEADQTTVLRRTHTDYINDSVYLGLRLIGLVSGSYTYQGSSNLVSKTTYCYDCDANMIAATPATPIQHDSYFDSTNLSTVKRGDLMVAARWDINYPDDASKKLYQHWKYDTAGNVLATFDGANHPTTISYADKFSTDGVNLDAPRSFATFAYPTSVTDADGFSSSVWYNYDFSSQMRVQTPLPNVTTNQPGPVTTFSYDEAIRPKQVTTVSTGAYVHYEYGPDYTSSFVSVNSVAANYWQSDSYTNQVFDGLGRVFAVASNHPGSNGGNKGQYTRYDQMGRAVQQTNPFEMDSGWNPTGDDVAGYQFNVANTFDWKGRPLKSYNMDGTYKEASYTGCSCAGGEVTTLTDEGTIDAGVAKRRQQRIYADVLGRTIKTELLNWEGGGVYATTVNTYNARDQVTLVRQYQGDESSATYQETTVTYDGYGRLKTKHVPQQQVDPNNSASTDHTTWTYNVDDTTDSITDARGASQTFTYNNNRGLVTAITYSAPSGITAAANVSYGYDAAGNRISMTDGVGSMTYTYDQLSRMTAETRNFTDLSGSYTLSYAYNLAGAITSLSEPSQFGATINYEYDQAGRLNAVTGSGLHMSSLLTGLQYRASGALKHATYGNGAQLNLTYNSRQLLTRYELSSVVDTTVYPPATATMGSQNQYYSDGQLSYAQDLRNGNFDRGYSYDHAGRLKEATSGREARGEALSNPVDSPYRQTYSYDAWNNLGRSTRLWSESQSDLPSYSNNRRDDWIYDASGNVKTELPSQVHTYDATGKQASFYEEEWSGPADNWVFHQNTINQTYDGSGQPGKRVETRHNEDVNGTITNDVTTTYYVRSSVHDGAIIAEIDQSGQRIGHVYVGGEKVADYSGWGSSGLLSFRHVNPATGNWITTQPNTNAKRTERDPLGATVGTVDPHPAYASYSTLMGNQPLYFELGNPFNPGGGCGPLDGMPISCSELAEAMNRGAVAIETSGGGRRNQFNLTPLGLGLFGVWIPNPDGAKLGPASPDSFVINHDEDDQLGHYNYFYFNPQRQSPQDTQVPLSRTEVSGLVDDVYEMFKKHSGCEDSINKFLNEVRASSGYDVGNIKDILEDFRKNGSISIEGRKGVNQGGAGAGNINISPDARGSAATVLGEIIHSAGHGPGAPPMGYYDDVAIANFYIKSGVVMSVEQYKSTYPKWVEKRIREWGGAYLEGSLAHGGIEITCSGVVNSLAPKYAKP